MKVDAETASITFDVNDLNPISLAQEKQGQDKALECLKRLVLSTGAVCPLCQNSGNAATQVFIRYDDTWN